MASTLHHPWRLDVPSRPPENAQEAVELADLAQALVAVDVDPGHRTFSAVWAPAPGGDKLVRDGVPDVIRRQGLVPVVRCCVDTVEYRRRLIEKAAEEIGEYVASVDEVGVGDLSTLADWAEVIDALAALDGHTFEDVLRAKAEKRSVRGGFDGGLVWAGNVTPPRLSV